MAKQQDNWRIEINGEPSDDVGTHEFIRELEDLIDIAVLEHVGKHRDAAADHVIEFVNRDGKDRRPRGTCAEYLLREMKQRENGPELQDARHYVAQMEAFLKELDDKQRYAVSGYKDPIARIVMRKTLLRVADELRRRAGS